MLSLKLIQSFFFYLVRSRMNRILLIIFRGGASFSIDLKKAVLVSPADTALDSQGGGGEEGGEEEGG
jgi:hypothetical protein